MRLLLFRYLIGAAKYFDAITAITSRQTVESIDSIASVRTVSLSKRMSFRFDRGDRRGDVEGKRANCEVYARIAQVQADANKRFRCGLRGPAWESDPQPHFRWCRYVPRRKVAEEQRNRSEELQRCFDKLGDFDE